MYEIVFDTNAENDLKRLPHQVGERIYHKIMSTFNDPSRYFSRLVGSSEYRMRIGHYRVIADIDLVNDRIIVHKIGHRRNIYDSF